ncbi:MAG: hypothetical protein KDJ45_07135 [Hyphomicrobiaceae bacterium]|nr:hypothetical protein [Hyphomicrobiaceae bacterium]
MSRSAQLWPGPRMRAFFRSILAQEPGLDARLVETLAERLTKRVNRMLVWDAVDGTDASYDSAASLLSSTASEGSDRTSSTATAKTTDTLPSAVDAQTQPDTGAQAETPFDPYAFSIIVVLKRQGATVLMQRLETVTNVAHLLQMASAQHIGVDKSITSVKKLRKAIVAGAEQRLADRRAAAS